MDPISMVVAALVAGATAALKETAGSAVKDGYAALKALVLARFHGDEQGKAQLAAVERRPEAGGAALQQSLAAAGADRDEALLRTAHQLLAQLDPAGARAGKSTVTVQGGKGVVVGDHATVTQTFND